MIENRAKAKIIEGIKLVGGTEGGPPPRPQWNPVDEKFKDVRIRSVGVYHDTAQGIRAPEKVLDELAIHDGDLSRTSPDGRTARRREKRDWPAPSPSSSGPSSSSAAG